MMQTKNLTIVPQSLEEVRSMVEALAPSDKAQLSDDWLKQLEASTAADPWVHGFNLVHRDSNTRVGTCGYKGPPDSNQIVEIAYMVLPEYQCRGYATETAQALVAYAFNSGLVRLVCAHTLPEPNASTRVLSKCGFRHSGEVVDVDDGLVWRWEIQP